MEGFVISVSLELENSVFSGLQNAEFDNGFSRDLNGFASCRVSACSGIAVLFHEFAKARNGEFAFFFGYMVSHVYQSVNKFAYFFSGLTQLVGQSLQDF